MPTGKADIETFIRSVPNILRLSEGAHILLVGYHLRQSGSTDFTSPILRNAFIRAKLSPPDQIDKKIKELAQGYTAPLMPIKKSRYSLSQYGLDEVDHYLKDEPLLQRGTELLKNLLPKILNKNQRQFLGEAILCAERGANRAAIVMTWLFVMDHLQFYVLNNKKTDFNTALSKRTDTKIKVINKKEDFEDLKECVFIEVMRSSKIITNDIRKILDTKLGIRNTCAHPSDIIIKQSKVVDFIEDLIDNVVIKYE